MNWTHMAELLASIPDLPGSRCKGRADLFEATVAEYGKPASRAELDTSRAAALRLCADCPALAPCRTWFNGLRPTRRPRGVVAGQIVRADGRITRAALAAIDDQAGVELTADRGRTRRAALVCHRATRTGPITAEWTYWDTCEQARQAEAEPTPCSPLCVGVHSVVRVEAHDGRTRHRRDESGR